MNADSHKITLRQILALQATVVVISLGGVFQKLAAGYPPMSLQFLLLYGCSLAFLFVYALLWQIVLKRVPLTVAYSNRAFSTFWALIWGAVLFHETIKWNHIAGAVVLCFGIFLVTTGGTDDGP